MSKQIVKCDVNMLRKIILGEVKKTKRGVLKEEQYTSENKIASEAAQALCAELSSTLNDWEKMHDAGDPSQEIAGGEGAWKEQVEAAVDELSTRMTEMLDEINRKLVDGEYYNRAY